MADLNDELFELAKNLHAASVSATRFRPAVIFEVVEYAEDVASDSENVQLNSNLLFRIRDAVCDYPKQCRKRNVTVEPNDKLVTAALYVFYAAESALEKSRFADYIKCSVRGEHFSRELDHRFKNMADLVEQELEEFRSQVAV